VNTRSEAAKKRWTNSEQREQARKCQTERWMDPELLKRHSEALCDSWKSPERKREAAEYWENGDNRIYRAGLGKKLWENIEYRTKQTAERKERWSNPEYIEKMRLVNADPVVSKKRSRIGKQLWQNPEHAKKCLHRRTPSGPEQKIIDILKSLSSELLYVGNGSYLIPGTRMNPDFVDKNKKLVIEVLGCFWHGCSKHYPDVRKQRQNTSRINKLKRLGYLVLIVWEHELKNHAKIVAKIKAFDKRR